MNLKFFPIVLLCFSWSYAIEFQGFDYDEAIEMEDEIITNECFFKVEVKNCDEGKNISTFTNNIMKTVMLEGEKAEICLPAVCSSLGDGIKLVDDVVIGGPGVEANPDVLKKGLSKDIFSTESECLRTSDVLSTVVCTEREPAVPNITMEQGNAKMQWDNWFHSILKSKCNMRSAMYQVESRHSSLFKDRLFDFKCKPITIAPFDHCYWTRFINYWDLPLFGHCPKNYVLNGVFSIYSYPHRDRIFKLRCCRAFGYYTKSCYVSTYLNNYYGDFLDVVYGREVFTGLFSIHSSHYHDRRWKIPSCKYVHY